VVIGVGAASPARKATPLPSGRLCGFVFGPQTLHRLPEMIAELGRTGRSVVDVSFPEIEKFDHLPAPRAEGATAFVSIMEGCSKYCSSASSYTAGTR